MKQTTISEKYLQQAGAIIRELDRRYHITRDRLFIDLLQCGINYAAAQWLEAMPKPASPYTNPSDPDNSPMWSDYAPDDSDLAEWLISE